MKDRTFYGFVSGLIAGISQTILNLISYYINFGQTRLFDEMAIILFGNKPIDSIQTITALVARAIFAGILGILFAHLMKYLNGEHYLFKGWVYGISLMGLIYGTTSLFQMPELTYSYTYTVITNFLDASLFGLVLAESLKRLLREKV